MAMTPGRMAQVSSISLCVCVCLSVSSSLYPPYSQHPLGATRAVIGSWRRDLLSGTASFYQQDKSVFVFFLFVFRSHCPKHTRPHTDTQTSTLLQLRENRWWRCWAFYSADSLRFCSILYEQCFNSVSANSSPCWLKLTASILASTRSGVRFSPAPLLPKWASFVIAVCQMLPCCCCPTLQIGYLHLNSRPGEDLKRELTLPEFKFGFALKYVVLNDKISKNPYL